MVEWNVELVPEEYLFLQFLVFSSLLHIWAVFCENVFWVTSKITFTIKIK